MHPWLAGPWRRSSCSPVSWGTTQSLPGTELRSRRRGCSIAPPARWGSAPKRKLPACLRVGPRCTRTRREPVLLPGAFSSSYKHRSMHERGRKPMGSEGWDGDAASSYSQVNGEGLESVIGVPGGGTSVGDGGAVVTWEEGAPWDGTPPPPPPPCDGVVHGVLCESAPCKANVVSQVALTLHTNAYCEGDTLLFSSTTLVTGCWETSHMSRKKMRRSFPFFILPSVYYQTKLKVAEEEWVDEQ